MWNTPIGRVRALALVEGISFLVLLGIAMPLKYLGGIPMAVKVVGWIHGLLFIALLAALASTAREVNWPLKRVAIVVLAALLPFGPFVLDPKLRAEDQSSG